MAVALGSRCPRALTLVDRRFPVQRARSNCSECHGGLLAPACRPNYQNNHERDSGHYNEAAQQNNHMPRFQRAHERGRYQLGGVALMKHRLRWVAALLPAGLLRGVAHYRVDRTPEVGHSQGHHGVVGNDA